MSGPLRIHIRTQWNDFITLGFGIFDQMQDELVGKSLSFERFGHRRVIGDPQRRGQD